VIDNGGSDTTTPVVISFGVRVLVGDVLEGGERRHDDYEAEVCHGEVEEEQVDDGAHALVGHDDVDDEQVTDQADERYDGEESRDDYHIEHETELGERRGGRGGGRHGAWRGRGLSGNAR